MLDALNCPSSITGGFFDFFLNSIIYTNYIQMEIEAVT